MTSDLEKRILLHLTAAHWTVGLAESCTGGMISAHLTDVSGASNAFRGGVVCYANEVKIALLGVKRETLEAHGAVSEEVAREMAAGARRALAVDVSLAVTGIAGPEGGTTAKPVGTIWVAIATPHDISAKLLHFTGGRAEIREAATQAALILLDETLLR